MALIKTVSGYSNVLAVTVDPVKVTEPPKIQVRKERVQSNEKLSIVWNDLARPITVEFSSDPNFSKIVKSVTGAGIGYGGLFVLLPVGTYWVRANWQDTVITQDAMTYVPQLVR